MADSTYLGISMSTGRLEVMSDQAAVVVRWISPSSSLPRLVFTIGGYSQDVLLSTFDLYHGKPFVYRFEAVGGCQESYQNHTEETPCYENAADTSTTTSRSNPALIPLIILLFGCITIGLRTAAIVWL
jgi:hypothetical protein